MSFRFPQTNYLIFSPNENDKFIKVSTKTIDLYEIKYKNSSGDIIINKIGVQQENEVIKSVSWHCCREDDSFASPPCLVAVGFMNGIIKLLNLYPSNDSDDFNLSDREIRPKHLKQPVFLSWNPWTKSMLAQVIDKSKSPWNEGCLLIWDFQKVVDLPGKGQSTTLASQTSSRSIQTTTNYAQISASSQIKVDSGTDQPAYDFCRGESINSLSWISSSRIIYGVNQKQLKLFDVLTNQTLKLFNCETVFGVCVNNKPNPLLIASYVDDRICIWDENNQDKPVLNDGQDNPIDFIEWSPSKNGYILVVFREKSVFKVIDTNIDISNPSHQVDHKVVDRYYKVSEDSHIISAAWYRQSDKAVLLYLANESFELIHIKTRRSISWSVEQKVVWYTDSILSVCPIRSENNNMSNTGDSINNIDQISGGDVLYKEQSNFRMCNLLKTESVNFLENDVICVMKQRALDGYGIKPVTRDYADSLFSKDQTELRMFWSWIEEATNNSHFPDNYSLRSKMNPHTGVIDCIRDVIDVKNNPEISFQMKEIVSQQEEVHWNNIFDALPFTKYTHSYRDKIFFACGWPFNKTIENWRYILESIDDKERAAAMAIVTLNFDVALQYLKRVPSDKGIESEMLALCLAGFNTQGGQNCNANWLFRCQDLLKRIGNSRPYLTLIFKFLIAKNKEDLQFLKDLNISLTDKLAIVTLYFDDEDLVDFLDFVSLNHFKNGNLEAIVMTGLKSTEFIDLLQFYVNRSMDVQTAAIAVLQASLLTKDPIVKTKRSICWVEIYRNILDSWALWFYRADFDVANQYYNFCFNKDSGIRVQKSQQSSAKSSRANSVVLPSTDQNQVYVACTYCGWRISQPSKYSNTSSRKITQKTKADPSFHTTTIISNFAMHAGGCKPTICQNCRKPLPRCSLCLMNMGVSNELVSVNRSQHSNFNLFANKETQMPLNPIGNWFMWCQRCKHGGHAEHLQQWFQEWSECPVSGCKCTCSSLDSMHSIVNTFDDVSCQD